MGRWGAYSLGGGGRSSHPGFPPHTMKVPTFINIDLSSERLMEQSFEENFEIFKLDIVGYMKP
jgi:hypothetical protein